MNGAYKRPISIRELFYLPAPKKMYANTEEGKQQAFVYNKGAEDYAFNVSSLQIDEVEKQEFVKAIADIHSGNQSEAEAIYARIKEKFWLLRKVSE